MLAIYYPGHAGGHVVGCHFRYGLDRARNRLVLHAGADLAMVLFRVETFGSGGNHRIFIR